MPEARTFKGSCHCGAVAYEVTTGLEKVISCNCSRCSRLGWLISFVPPDDFRLLSGEEVLAEYRFNTHNIAHLFCRQCGIESFARGRNREGAAMIAVNVRCLDGVDLASLEITEVDGRSR